MEGRQIQEIVRPARWREIVSVWLGVLVLTLVANQFARWALDRYTVNSGYRLIEEKWKLLLDAKQPVDWLILGDSSCNQGVVPERLSAALGGTTLNLCTIGDALVLGDSWMLDLYTRRVGPPKHVLLVHVYDVWHRDVSPVQDAIFAWIPLPWGFWNQYEPQLTFTRWHQLRMIIRRRLPLYYENTSLGRIIMRPWTSYSEQLVLGSDGFMSMTKADPRHVEVETREHLQFVRHNRPRVSPVNRLALQAIGRLAEQHHFDVYLAESPIYEGLYGDPTSRAHIDTVWSEVGSVLSPSGRIRQVGMVPIVFGRDQMQSADHVILSAARQYTQDLADAIRTGSSRLSQ
jgi:hypothetical protein